MGSGLHSMRISASPMSPDVRAVLIDIERVPGQSGVFIKER